MITIKNSSQADKSVSDIILTMCVPLIFLLSLSLLFYLKISPSLVSLALNFFFLPFLSLTQTHIMFLYLPRILSVLMKCEEVTFHRK